MLLILGDGYENIAPILSRLTIVNEQKWGMLTLYDGIKDGTNILIAETGYGKVNMGLALGYILSRYSISAIIGTGNAASLDENFAPLRTIAISASALQWDVDYSPIGYPETVVPEMGVGTFRAGRRLVSLAEDTAFKCGFCFRSGKFASGDNFVASTEDAQYISNDFKADFVDSDSSFIAQIAHIFSIPFVYIKGVSNFANGSAPSEYTENKECANNMAATVVYSMLDTILSHGCW